MKRIVTGLLILLSLPLWAQNWEAVKADRTRYIYGEGFGETMEEADERALADLVSKISIAVEHEFTQVDQESSSGANVDSRSNVVSKLKTFSGATLNNTERIILANEPNAHVGRYILRSDLNKIFEGRIQKVKDYALIAEKSLEKCKIDDALRFCSWAHVLLQSVPGSASCKYTTQNGKDVLLSIWLPEKIDEILDNVEISFLKKDKYDALCSFSYNGQPVTSLDYTAFDGRDWSNVYSAKDGCGVIELPSDLDIDQVQIKLEYLYRSQAHIDKDVEAVMRTAKPKYYKAASKNVSLKGKAKKPNDVRETVTRSSEKTAAMVQTAGIRFLEEKDSKQYASAMADISSSIKTRQWESVRKHFTDDAYVMFNSLIRYGNARVLDDTSCKYYTFRDGVVARSIKMAFSFSRGVQKSFVEDIVFTFGTDGKVKCLAFGLNSEALSCIATNTFWNEATRMCIVEFLENYKTAYSLKRMDYLESIFDDDAVIVVGHVAFKQTRTGIEGNGLTFTNKHVVRTRYSKAEYMKHLEKCFASNEFVNLRFLDNTIRKYNQGGETYGIQIKQDYYSTNYGDSGYLFLMVDLNNPALPVIKVRTWQENSVPINELVDINDY